MITYAVSVQWGKGHHYFIHGPQELEGDKAIEALGEFAAMQQERQNKNWIAKGSKGVKPVVRVWEMVKQYQPPKKAG